MTSAAPDPQRQIASLPIAVLTLGPGLMIEAVNPAAEQLFGQSARRLTGRNLGSVVTFEEPRLVNRLAEGDANLSAHAMRVQIGRQPSRTLDVMAAPVSHSPGWQMLALVESGSVDALASDDGPEIDSVVLRAPEILAHEIKNPLAGIRGAAQLLARSVPNEQRALTTLIADEVDRIAKLIDQMQPLSRKIAEPLAPCNLHEAVRRARTILLAAHDEIVLDEAFDPSLPPVLASADGLVQILLNLLTNAYEASLASRTPRIAIRTRFASGIRLHARSQRGAIRLPIEVRISDNGPGIDPALREHLFEPFVTSKKDGQGLGLALVQKLVRDMNGRVTVDRDEDEGMTHFRIHLPVASAVATAQGVAA